MSRWNRLLYIESEVLAKLRSPLDDASIFERLSVITKKSDVVSTQTKVTTKRVKEQYSIFGLIKKQLVGVSNLSVKLAQTVFVFKMNRGAEIDLSIGKLKSHLYLCNRPERLTNVATLESLTLGINANGVQRLLLNPWTISVELCLFWESWQQCDSNPQIHVTVESDCFVLDISSEQIKCIEMLVNELQEFLTENLAETQNTTTNPTTFITVNSERDQHYKDDLRAGAFQFVDATTNNTDELPLPYQVMFWNQNISAMAWRYPQPRVLTKVRVFPVPFQLASEEQTNRQLYGNLEYWSDCQGCYMPYIQFALSESEITHLVLPESQPMPIVAATWRVVLCTPNYSNQNTNYDYSGVLISSRALAACMRIDSYFNVNLIPIVNVAMQISKINISLHNNFNKNTPCVIPNNLKPFACDMAFPETQCFLTLNIDNIRSFVTLWNAHVASLDFNSTIQCSVLDYTYLTQQDFIEPFTSKLQLSISNNVCLNLISKPIHFKFGPCTAHTFAVSAQNWHQSNETHLIIMTHYVICNDTNLILCFGQAGTDEDIVLLSRHCHLYSWRSQKSKQMIKIGLEEKTKIWSKPFSIDVDGTAICIVSHENNICVVVTVKSLSATQKQIIFSGQLIFSNMLLEHFEVKIVRATREDKEREFKQAPKYIVNGQSTPPSLVLNMAEKYFLRLRFFGLESAWSGDIPLLENTKCAQPWLVKGKIYQFKNL